MRAGELRVAVARGLRYFAPMRKTSFLVAALAFSTLSAVSSSACDKGARSGPGAQSQAPQGIPAGGSGAVNAPGAPAAPSGADPHAGIDMNGADPHAGVDMGGGANPHGMANPHGGGGGMEGNMPTPEALDPATVIKGTIDVSPALAGKVKPGDVIFLSLKTVDPTTGELRRPPLAVDRIEIQKLPQAFELSNQKLMIPGAKIEGQVAVSARIDRDVDAMTRAAGDLEGIVKTKPPQKDLKVIIDTEVQ